MTDHQANTRRTTKLLPSHTLQSLETTCRQPPDLSQQSPLLVLLYYHHCFLPLLSRLPAAPESEPPFPKQPGPQPLHIPPVPLFVHDPLQSAVVKRDATPQQHPENLRQPCPAYDQLIAYDPADLVPEESPQGARLRVVLEPRRARSAAGALAVVLDRHPLRLGPVNQPDQSARPLPHLLASPPACAVAVSPRWRVDQDVVRHQVSVRDDPRQRPLHPRQLLHRPPRDLPELPREALYKDLQPPPKAPTDLPLDDVSLIPPAPPGVREHNGQPREHAQVFDVGHDPAAENVPRLRAHPGVDAVPPWPKLHQQVASPLGASWNAAFHASVRTFAAAAAPVTGVDPAVPPSAAGRLRQEQQRVRAVSLEGRRRDLAPRELGPREVVRRGDGRGPQPAPRQERCHLVVVSSAARFRNRGCVGAGAGVPHLVAVVSTNAQVTRRLLAEVIRADGHR
ncbi:hypothetical protein CSUB01_08528 [Colletotrichum sublineola]|uniref:Uncharacterized protein n=1 Tax=Colletotrichum sublineola TaxID=1173701 RepID=A0A066WUI1_COLSU|nr:hypothetical protein CSUB01_08528 [Colletotrichum sublineola]